MANIPVQRAGKIVGSLGRAIDDIYHKQTAVTDIHDSYRKKHNYHDDIELFINEYRDERFFDNIPGRQHDSFPLFQCDSRIKKPEKLKGRFVKYSKKLDRSRQVRE